MKRAGWSEAVVRIMVAALKEAQGCVARAEHALVTAGRDSAHGIDNLLKFGCSLPLLFHDIDVPFFSFSFFLFFFSCARVNRSI